MKRVLVTGASGFVGANLARRLVADGHEVYLFVRKESDLWRVRDMADSLRLVEVSLLDFEPVTEAVRRIRPEWIFHCAVYGAYSWQNDWRRMCQTNIAATINLVEACLSAGFEAFVNTGSSSEYGFKDDAPGETERLDPNSYYAVTKASASQYCSFIGRQHNVRIVTLRLYSIYGPYEEPNRFVPTLTINALEGRLPPLVDPRTARDYVYVDDTVAAYLMAASTAGQESGAVYNVGTGRQTSIAEAVEAARRIFGLQAEPAWGSMPNRSWDTNVWVCNNTKITEALGWQPSVSFDQGLALLADWFAANPHMLDRYRKSIADPAPVGVGGAS
ncbi:MAG TPA: NAD-dependent epimerase/dehydratase family protein [Candidatus Obscuribacterales bacterium]